MRIEVWKEPEPKPEVEKVVRLRIWQGRADVYLEVVDEKGARVHGGCLGTVGVDGVKRMGGIDPALGFPLDAKGRIVLVGED